MADFMVIRRGDSLVPCDKHGYEALSKYPFEKALKTSLKQPFNLIGRYHDFIARYALAPWARTPKTENLKRFVFAMFFTS